jgi:2-polyprenyl-6-hydroxyphenyl methylase/3-demethylubiquinone-9 3-methyltransferase
VAHAEQLGERLPVVNDRFAFGRNWQKLVRDLSPQKIQRAQASVQLLLGRERLNGLRFLDVGCGSGLFSLVARRLGASVVSFDFDPLCVQCATGLRERYFPGDTDWRIEQGSVLDLTFIQSLGQFDVVYAWGVLHHTGQMWQAIDHASMPVKRDGLLVLALYNDQGVRSSMWKTVKRIYCSGWLGRIGVTATGVPALIAYGAYADLRRAENPLTRYFKYGEGRGMSVVRDWIDWLGGYPFEVAKPAEVVEFEKRRGFTADRARTTTSLGNNEFVFRRALTGAR